AQDVVTHHGALGSGRVCHDVRIDAAPILWGPISARRLRGGLLPGFHSVFHLLVSVSQAGSGDRDLHVGHHDSIACRGTAVRIRSEILRWFRRSSWLAMAVPGAGITRYFSRLFGLPSAEGQT